MKVINVAAAGLILALAGSAALATEIYKTCDSSTRCDYGSFSLAPVQTNTYNSQCSNGNVPTSICKSDDKGTVTCTISTMGSGAKTYCQCTNWSIDKHHSNDFSIKCGS